MSIHILKNHERLSRENTISYPSTTQKSIYDKNIINEVLIKNAITYLHNSINIFNLAQLHQLQIAINDRIAELEKFKD
jgi:hypothetical protein